MYIKNQDFLESLILIEFNIINICIPKCLININTNNIVIQFNDKNLFL